MVTQGVEMVEGTKSCIGDHLEKLVKSSIDRATQEIYWITPEGRFICVNETARKKLGYSKDELEGMYIWDIDPKHDGEESREKQWKELKKEGSMTFETKHKTKDGETYPVEINSQYIEFEGKEYEFAFAKDITKRKKAEKELKEERKKYKNLFYETPLGVFFYDAKGTIKECNDKFVEIIGSSRKDLIGLNMLKDLKNDELIEEVRSSLEDGKGYYEGKYFSVTGEKTTHVRVFLKGIKNEEEEIKSGIALIEDFTDRKEMEKELQKERKRFLEIFNNANDAIYLHELDENGMPGNFIEVNDVACEMLGYTRKKLLQMSPQDINSSEKTEEVPEVMDKLLEEGDARFEIHHQTKDGTEIPVEIHSHLFELEGKERILSIARNISKRKRAKEELKEKHRQLKTMFSNLPGMAYRCLNNKNWTMKFISEGCVELTGYNSEELIDDKKISFSELIIPEDREKVWEEVQESVRENENFKVSYRIKTKDGEEKWVWEQGEGIYEDGEVKFLEGIIQDITERKEREKELKRKNIYLEHSPEFMTVTDEEGEVKFLSQGASKATGLDLSEVMGSSGFEFLHPEDREKIQKMFPELLKNPGKEYKTEIRGKTEEGWRWFEVRAVNYLDDPEVEGIISTSRDITEKKKTEKNFEKLFNASPDPTFIISKKGEFKEVNQAAKYILGYQENEIIGKTLSEVPFFPPKTKEKLIKNLEKRIKGKEVSPYTIEVESKSGKQLYAEINSALIGEKSDPDGIIGIARNITERKKAEERLKTFVNTIPDLVVVFDEEGYYKEILTSHHKLLVEPKEELLGKRIDKVMPEELGDRWLDYIQRTIESGEVQSFEYALDLDGEKHWFEARALPLQRKEKDSEYVVSAIRDITEKKKTKQELLKSEERKDFLNTLLRQDLGSKYQNIQGYLQLLEEETDIPEKQKQYLKKAIKTGRRVDEILGLAKKLEEIEGKELTGEKDINKVIELVIDSISGLIERKEVEIKESYLETMTKVEGDYSLNTLFTQLLVTRIQLAECTKIKISASEKEKDVLVRIEDNGEKLPNNIKNMFTGEAYTGETTGVGGVRYYMIRQIAEHNNAKIEIKDSELGGARFDIHLQKP